MTDETKPKTDAVRRFCLGDYGWEYLEQTSHGDLVWYSDYETLAADRDEWKEAAGAHHVASMKEAKRAAIAEVERDELQRKLDATTRVAEDKLEIRDALTDGAHRRARNAEAEHARREALEEAADVARNRWRIWSRQGDDCGVECDVTACENISRAILALIDQPATDEPDDLTTAYMAGAHSRDGEAERLRAHNKRLVLALQAILEISVEPAETDHKSVREWIEKAARAALAEGGDDD